MCLVDLHTHNIDCGRNAILNCDAGNIIGDFCSVGIHPWHITENWHDVFDEISVTATNNQVVAIGECGFDFVKSPASRELQYSVFKAHVNLSETTRKPLIIHSVKGFEELIRASKESLHKESWIIHGFRGKPEQAQQLLSAGFYLSFGMYFNEESVRITPLERLFIESDESKEPVADIYAKVAFVRHVGIEQLSEQIYRNAAQCKIFFQ